MGIAFERWQRLMQAFGFEQHEKTLSSLLAAYSEKHRYYHTAEHIAACLRHLDSAVKFAQAPTEIELALWFHDAIYVPRKSDNEYQSAKWASAFLHQHRASQEVIDRVFHLVMATQHNSPASTSDEALLVDIDLSILGASSSVYANFEKAIRKEYKWVPYFLYKKKRKEVLEQFLRRKRLYTHRYFFDLLEEQARSNLTHAIGNLL